MARRKSNCVPMVDRDWRARDDMRTLIAAQEIKGDKSRLEAAQRAAREERTALSSITRARPKATPKRR